MTTAELIEKLERAEPCARFDEEIHCAMIGVDPLDYDGPLTVPGYTASIDAALTLVPEGWSYTVAWLHRNGRATVAMFHAKLNEQRAESHTPAIALCIAALKAKEAVK